MEQSEPAQRLGMAVGLVAIAVVGIATPLAASSGIMRLSGALTVVWWAAYGLYVAAFVIADRRYVWGRDVEQAAVAAQVLLGVVVLVLQADTGLGAVLLVVTAASASYVWSAPVVTAVIVGQTLAVAVGATLADVPGSTVVLSVLAYACFQAFAALLVFAERREAAARRDLAITHAELGAATTLLEASARDAERLRISRELHDVMGHELTALALELEVAGHHVDGPGAEHVERARTIAKGLLQGVRQTVGQLREERGLLPALDALVADVPGLTVDLRVQEDVPLGGDRALVVVRCVQEVLTNTLRHSGADRVTIEVVSDHTGLRLAAADDGRGVERVTPGHGLSGIAERFAELGGSVRFTSRPGRGFSVDARVPAP